MAIARKNPILPISLKATGLLVGLLAAISLASCTPPVAKPEPVEIPDVEGTQAKAERGDADAQYNLGRLYAKGLGVKDDYKEATRWYRQAADQGHARAQVALGEHYAAGQGVPQDNAEAVKWYRRAAEQGDATGQYTLAVMYLVGTGVPKDDAEALKWYRASAEQGYALSLFHLGMRYKKGQGVTPDSAEAYKWLTLAAANGIAEATEIRDDLKSRMTREQIAEGRRRADAFVPKKPMPPAK